MIKLPPGVRFDIDSLKQIKTPRNLKATAVEGTSLVSFTIAFDVPLAEVNKTEIDVSEESMKNKAHFAFEKGSTETIEEKDNLEIVLDPSSLVSRGIIDVYSFFTISDGKVGGAGPSLKFQSLAKKKAKK